jgi:hypothetical protein
MPQTPARNLAKPFSIAGFILGVIYGVFTVLGPSPSGEVVPWQHLLGRVVALTPFFGIFGALIGLGLGLLASGAVAAIERLRR